MKGVPTKRKRSSRKKRSGLRNYQRFSNASFKLSGNEAYSPPSGVDRGGHTVVENVKTGVGNFHDPVEHSFTKSTGVAGPWRDYNNNINGGSRAWHDCTGKYFGSAFNSIAIPGNWDSCLDKAMEKQFNYIRGGGPNLLVDALEISSTRKMLKDISSLNVLFEKFYHGAVRTKQYRRLGKGSHDPSLSQRRLDYLSGKWLELQYGWKPFVSSIYDTLDQVFRARLDTDFKVQTSSSSMETWQTFAGDGSYANPRLVQSHVLKRRVILGIWYHLPQTRLTQLLSYTSLNPAVILYEKTALSFVADWVVNIGQTLYLWENYLWYYTNFRKGFRTDSYEYVAEREWNGRTFNVFSPTASQERIRREVNSYRQAYMGRTSLTSLPSPTGFRLKVSLGATRITSAAALFQQLVMGRIRKL